MTEREKQWILTHIHSGKWRGIPWIAVPNMGGRKFTLDEILEVLRGEKER